MVRVMTAWEAVASTPRCMLWLDITDEGIGLCCRAKRLTPTPCTAKEAQPALCKKQREHLLCIFCIDSLDPIPTPPTPTKKGKKKYQNTKSTLLSSPSPFSLFFTLTLIFFFKSRNKPSPFHFRRNPFLSKVTTSRHYTSLT